MHGTITGIVWWLFAMIFFVQMTRTASMWADALTLLVWKVYAVAVASKHSCLASCVQKANTLTFFI